MATLNSDQLLSAAMAGLGTGTPGGFQMASNALSRAELTGEMGLQQERLQGDFERRTLPDLASNQAARGAFFSGATRRKAGRASEDFLRGFGDIGRQGAFSLSRLGLSDIGASIPGVSW